MMTLESSSLNALDFKPFFKKHYSMLCNLAYKYIGDKEACEDIVQDIFVRFFELNKMTLSEQESVAYLVQAVRNNSISSLRKERSAPVRLNDRTVETRITTVVPDDSESAEIPDPTEIADAALSSLPPKCGAIFKMSRLEKMSYKQIASTLNISEKTVENQMSKAIRILREFAANNRIWLVMFFIVLLASIL